MDSEDTSGSLSNRGNCEEMELLIMFNFLCEVIGGGDCQIKGARVAMLIDE